MLLTMRVNNPWRSVRPGINLFDSNCNERSVFATFNQLPAIKNLPILDS